MPARSCSTLFEQGFLSLQDAPQGQAQGQGQGHRGGRQGWRGEWQGAWQGGVSESQKLLSTSFSESGTKAHLPTAATPSPSSPSTSSSSPPSKIIFEDVDGVLNHSRSGDGTLDPQLLKNLGNLVRTTDASLVISSAWRKHEEGLQWLIEKGLVEGAGIPKEKIIGQTPSLCWGVDCRAAEIRAWLDSHPEVAAAAKWVAIDDQDVGSQDPDYMAGHFVRTDASKGLTKSAAARAHELLVPEESPASIRAAWSDAMKSFL